MEGRGYAAHGNKYKKRVATYAKLTHRSTADICIENEIKLTGILAIEMFLNNNDKILFNEIAPRPHNSGHLTIQSHSISQFGLLGEIVSNKKISKPLSNKKAVMKNILGEFFNKKNYREILNEIKNMDNHYLKLYNKDEAKPGRKMGHVTIITNDIENSLVKINALID